MEPFKQHTGVVAPLDRVDVDTDQIIPKQFLKSISRTGYGQNCFNDWRYREDGSLNPDFVLNRPEYQGASVLVARANFGCGSSREHAPWSLEDYGFKAIVAPSFADIFYSNCTKIGLLPVPLDEADVEALMDATEAEIDLEAQVVRFDGREVPFEIDEGIKHRLLNGLDDIALTLAQSEAIESYERERERSGPVTTAL